MGAWEVGNFENDAALDWVYDLEKCTDGSFVLQTLRGAIDAPKGPIEDGEEALAAAEVVAAVASGKSSSLPQEVAAWATDFRHSRNSGSEGKWVDEALKLAVGAVRRVLDDSDIAECWGEVEEAPQWRALQTDLIARLEGMIST